MAAATMCMRMTALQYHKHVSSNLSVALSALACHQIPRPCLLMDTKQLSSCSASITRLKKRAYPRMYKACLVQPDGSSYVIRYPEPRKIISLPIDPATLTEEEKKARMKRLKPEKPKEIYELEEEDANFDQRSWANLVNKR